MHNVFDVRDLNLYSGKKPKEIWEFYKNALDTLLDSGDRSRDFVMKSKAEYPS